MAFRFELQPALPLQLTPDCLVYSGTVRMFVTGIMFQSSGAPADSFGFALPDAPPLIGDADEPRVWAEASLMTGTATAASGAYPFGVEWVRAAYLPDPRGGTSKWLNLFGGAHIGREIRVAYRVTVATV
ncbi:hypothetical protein [Nocardia noduli]|uniref:hypothetical protein n=1 Tax=Nocardia noduli TaxID=2815722 RepID=UPI001C24AB70|nr:hypothetical protein [Nocardia noduli]